MSDDVRAQVTVGAIVCEPISDGGDEVARGDIFGDVDAATLAGAGVGPTISIPYTPVLIRSAGSLILVDAGAGADLAAGWGIPAGRMLESLAAAGVAPDRIDMVVVSHGHPDHVGGLSVAAGEDRVPTFPRARVIISRREWDFFTGPDGLAYDEDDVAVFRSRLEPSRDAGLLDTVDAGEEISPGIRLVAAPGHTPGHCAVEIESEGERAVYVGDAMLHPVMVEHPEWTGEFDHDRPLTETTRHELLRLAAADGRRWIAYHFGSTGRVERAGDGYRFASV
jgi:glyoxylase-like metal-dependent hydrolase (beta-lactamase superfamily II)